MRYHLALNLIILPYLCSAAAPPAACTSDEQCSVTQRSRVPSESNTDVGLCGCYATSSIDPFDECEGNKTSCATARCISDACAGLTSTCSDDSVNCVLIPDEGMNPANQQKFADDLTKILFTEPNECTSSLGVSMAFSLVYPGATNDGISEIKNTFGYPDGSNLQLVWQGATQRMLKSANGECSASFDGECFSNAPLLKIANSVWLDSDDKLNEEYASVVDDYAMQTNFSSIESPTIFEERNTNLDTFYASPSRSTKVADAHFMHTVEYFDYSHDALVGYQVLKLRLQQSKMSMMFVLPLTDKAGAVTSTDLINANRLGRLESTKIALALPKFKFESEYEDNLKSALIALGVKAPFTESTNSLCGLLQDYDCGKLIISHVIQKTVIDVNEQGVEASAVTALGVSFTSIPPPDDPILMVLDHPFQFFIYEEEEELMLFEGRLGDPDVPEKEPLLNAKHSDSDFWSSNFFESPIEAAPLLDETTTSSTEAFVDCSTLTTCSECLENEGCAHWTADECHASCVMADASCYTNTGGFAGMTVDEICTKADDDRKDSTLCGSMTDCTSCIEAVQSDGKTCMWFEDDGFCDTGCNMIGCGSTDATTCQATTTTGATVGGDATTTQATVSQASTTTGATVGGDATTAQATVSQATIPADTTTTISTGSIAPASTDPDSSGNIYSLFASVCTTIFMASILFNVW
eukprot:scaffold2472_cov209-Skeletonema_dohrnii-CCMP3373.AAC.4